MRELEVIKRASNYFRNDLSCTVTRPEYSKHFLWSFKTLGSRLQISFYGKLKTDRMREKRTWGFQYYANQLVFEDGPELTKLRQCYLESMCAENSKIELLINT